MRTQMYRSENKPSRLEHKHTFVVVVLDKRGSDSV